VRGYHPLLAIAAGTGDVLMARLREGRANTARGAAHFLRETIGRVRHAGATGQLTVRADSGFYAAEVVKVCRTMKVRFSITIRQHRSVRALIEAIPESAWTPIPYWIDGGADVAETTYLPFATEKDARPVRLIVRRVRPTPGSQLALLVLYDYHAFITDRPGETLELEADHRRHAEIENAIRDLKYGMGLNHLPSGRFAANGAWLAVQVMATISPAGRLGSASARASSRPRPFVDGSSASPAGSPDRRAGGPSICRLAGRGRSTGSPLSPSSGRSRSWPDRRRLTAARGLAGACPRTGRRPSTGSFRSARRHSTTRPRPARRWHWASSALSSQLQSSTDPTDRTLGGSGLMTMSSQPGRQ